MGFFNSFSNAFSPKGEITQIENSVEDEKRREVIVNLEEVGQSGTEVFAGQVTEEYLQELLDQDGPDQFDKMRRSDAKVKMALSAVKNPIRKANWQVEPFDQSPVAVDIADFVKFNLFEGMQSTWQEILTEATSVADFGHVAFEIVHKVQLNDPKFGDKIMIDNLAFRSQRKISRWNIKQNGKLESLEMQAYGDTGNNATIPGKFILTFALEKEGDNYPGISMLRPAYGAWKRKGLYLKLLAIGIEKFAVPTVIGEVPEGKQNSDEIKNFKKALKMYASHQSNYITRPRGWEVEVFANKFDPEKVIKAIQFENNEIAIAFLANFLELGQSGSGSYALGTDLSDFFLSSIEYIAWIICENIQKKVIEPLVKMNYGSNAPMPKLTCSGISDKVGKEFAEVIKNLLDSSAITADSTLEAHIRQRFDLPEKQEMTETQVELEMNEIKLALEKSEKTPLSLMNNREKILLDIMRKNLVSMGGGLARKVSIKFDDLPKGRRASATRGESAPNKGAYKKELREFLTTLASDSLSQARKEIPSGEDIKLSDGDDLPPSVKNKISNQVDLLVDSQTADLEKATFFQYQNSESTTNDLEIIESDLNEAAEQYAFGPSVLAASGNTTALIVNETRNIFFFSDAAIEQVESFTFVNPSPDSDICRSLVGKTFKATDASALRNFPPLHHNCKSYLVPNLKGATSRPLTPGGLTPTGTDGFGRKVTNKKGDSISPEKALKSITLSEDADYSASDLSEFEPIIKIELAGAHYHLDSEGKKTGPSQTDGSIHYHSIDGGGRTESAHDEKGHSHREPSGLSTGLDVPIEEKFNRSNIVLEGGDLIKVVISKEIAETLQAAGSIAKEFDASISEAEELENEFVFVQKSGASDADCKTFKPKSGVSLVFC